MLTRILPIAATALSLSATLAPAQVFALADEAPAAREATSPVMPAATAVLAMQPGTGLGVPIAGPRLDGSRLGITAMSATAHGAFDPTPQPSIARRRGVPQMIIGGAAILGGAIVGGDAGAIVSLAGLGYGLFGLYLYLQ